MTSEMTSETETILSALLDGEPVDPADLARALESPEAPGILRDFALIRGEIVAGTGTPGPGLYAGMEPHLAAAGRRRKVWPAAAAAAAALVVWGVWSESDRLRDVFREWEGPPDATRIIRFVPGQDWQGD